MRLLLRATPALALLPAAALAPAVAQAQEGGDGGASSLLSPNVGLMFWTLLIFVALLVILSKYAFGPLTAAVEARERALEDAIAGARRDRDAAAQLLAEQQAALEATRAEAQGLIAQARASAEKMRADQVEQTRAQQAELLERARRDIDAERARAIADLRREAVDLALAGATKVIGRNLDDAGNRRLVEDFLATVPPLAPNTGGRAAR